MIKGGPTKKLILKIKNNKSYAEILYQRFTKKGGKPKILEQHVL